MKWKDAIRKYEWVAIPLVLVVASFLGGSYYGQRKVLASITEHRDTVIKIATIYKDFPQPQKTALSGFIGIPRYKFLTDTLKSVETLVLHDTTVVYLPREEKYYEEADGRLRIWVSGYEPRLDRYELDERTITINNTVQAKPPRWGFSVNGGYGVALTNSGISFAPYVGFGLSYTFLWL